MDNSGFNIAEMNDETLQYLLSACEKEMQARKQIDRKRKWDAVVNAICDYTKEYGAISFYNSEYEFSIGYNNINFSTIGFIEKT